MNQDGNSVLMASESTRAILHFLNYQWDYLTRHDKKIPDSFHDLRPVAQSCAVAHICLGKVTFISVATEASLEACRHCI